MRNNKKILQKGIDTSNRDMLRLRHSQTRATVTTTNVRPKAGKDDKTMKLTDTVTVNLTRSQLCSLMMACTALTVSHKNEAADPETTDSRREVCLRTAEAWKTLHDCLKAQLENQPA